MLRLTRAVIVGGLALLVVLLTCSPLWQISAGAGKRVISAWQPTPGALVSVAHRPTVTGFHQRVWRLVPEDDPTGAVPGAARYRVESEALAPQP